MFISFCKVFIDENTFHCSEWKHVPSFHCFHCSEWKHVPSFQHWWKHVPSFHCSQLFYCPPALLLFQHPCNRPINAWNNRPLWLRALVLARMRKQDGILDAGNQTSESDSVYLSLATNGIFGDVTWSICNRVRSN